MNGAIILDGQLDSLLDRLGNTLQARERQHGAHLHGRAGVNLDRAERSRLKAERFILAASCRERCKECDVEYSLRHCSISPDCVGLQRKVLRFNLLLQFRHRLQMTGFNVSL